jgi:hypothetical protein
MVNTSSHANPPGDDPQNLQNETHTSNPVHMSVSSPGPKHLRRLRVAENFISAYVCLCEDYKAEIEQFLALSAYGEVGMYHYAPRSKRNRLAFEHSCDWGTTPVGEAWSRWAKMIARAILSEFERSEAIREMLGVLIAQKNKDSLAEPELREAAEKALAWTRWDLHNRVSARILNSPEQAKQYLAWMRKPSA